MDRKYTLSYVRAFVFLGSFFFWFLILPEKSRLSAIVLFPLTFAFSEGVILFVRGFLVYRKYRVLTGLPRSSIRSLAMGPVEIHGKSVGQKRVVSPVSRSLCFYYEVRISGKGGKDGEKGKIESVPIYGIDADGVPFYLQDETGKVRVELTGVECDLSRQIRRHAASGLNLRSVTQGLGLAKEPAIPSEKDLMAYGKSALLRAGLCPQHIYSLEFDEYCVVPDRWYDLTGTCTDNPDPENAEVPNAIVQGEEEKTFLISSRTEAAVEAALRHKAILLILGGSCIMVLSFFLSLLVLGLI